MEAVCFIIMINTTSFNFIYVTGES